MSNIYLLRHGKVNGRAALYGKTDIEVSLKIKNDMLNLLMKNQNKFSHIVTSPLKRCAELAHEFAKQADKPIDVITNLQEMNFGDYDGLAFDDIPYTDISSRSNISDDISDNINDKVSKKINDEAQTWIHLERFWHNPAEYSLPNAEKLNDFYLRVKNAWQQLLSDYTDENILLVTHGGVIRMILAQVLGLDWKNEKLFNQLHIANATLTQLSNVSCNHKPYLKVHAIALPLCALNADEQL
ncbi:MAG: alpha-ribazole phosphatase [Alteromonadaceae bacterium]|jgi:alpha-ribazole phosphatase